MFAESMLKEDYYWLPWDIFFTTSLSGAFNEPSLLNVDMFKLMDKIEFNEILELSAQNANYLRGDSEKWGFFSSPFHLLTWI